MHDARMALALGGWDRRGASRPIIIVIQQDALCQSAGPRACRRAVRTTAGRGAPLRRESKILTRERHRSDGRALVTRTCSPVPLVIEDEEEEMAYYYQ